VGIESRARWEGWKWRVGCRGRGVGAESRVQGGEGVGVENRVRGSGCGE